MTELVEDLGITRPLTVLLLDGTSAVRNRIASAPRETGPVAALEVLTAGPGRQNGWR